MSESTDQQALFDLLARAEGRYPVLARVAHIPNGEKRDKGTAARLKAMGVRPGIPDIIAPFRNRGWVRGDPPGTYTALAIELKTKEGRLSPEQKAWGDHLRAEGWVWGCCFDWTDAARLILTWAGADPAEWGVLG